MNIIEFLFTTKTARRQDEGSGLRVQASSERLFIAPQTLNLEPFTLLLLTLCLCGYLSLLAGCGAAELKPVDLFPEDECANCRMAVSDPAFASEIISQENEVFKFDDLSCLEQFRKKRNDVQIAAMFVKDYESKAWLRYEKSRIILTGIETPMGSGRIAVSSNEQAKELTKKYPVKEISAKMGKDCCGDEGCSK